MKACRMYNRSFGWRIRNCCGWLAEVCSLSCSKVRGLSAAICCSEFAVDWRWSADTPERNQLESEQDDEKLTLFSGISGRAKVGGWKLALCSRYKGKLLI